MARGDDREVRGPTSALTSFLREKGIRAPTGNRFTRNAPAPVPTPAVLLTPTAIEEEEEPPVSVSPTKRRNIIEDSENEEEVSAPIASSSTGPQPPAPKANKQALKKQKKLAKEKAELADELAELGVPSPVPKQRYANRTPGAFNNCSECGNRFTFTKYTASAADGRGVLCPACEKEAGLGSLPKPKAPAQKRSRAVKAKPLTETRKKEVRSLQDCCIRLIGKHIKDIEELGEVGSVNLDKICKIVCKNRGLNNDTLKLFLSVESTRLALYDCASLEDDALEQITIFAPHLKQLTLNYCGALKDSVVDHMIARMDNLERIELYGSFLITSAKWQAFFDSFLQADREPLKGFLLRQSPRFDSSCVLRLVENFPNLTELRLAEIQKIDGHCLRYLHGLKALEYLDLSHGGLTCEAIEDDDVISLLANVGSTLISLVLNENFKLGNRTLVEGIRPNCPRLRHLGLRLTGQWQPVVVRAPEPEREDNDDEQNGETVAGSEEKEHILDSSGMTGLFSDWDENTGLETLDISRCIHFDDLAIQALVSHSGRTLVDLSMNSVDADVTEMGIRAIAEGCEALQRLDLGFVRAVDDFNLKEIMDRCTKLKWISVFGCNRVTDFAPSKTGVQMVGGEGNFKIRD